MPSDLCVNRQPRSAFRCNLSPKVRLLTPVRKHCAIHSMIGMIAWKTWIADTPPVRVPTTGYHRALGLTASDWATTATPGTGHHCCLTPCPGLHQVCWCLTGASPPQPCDRRPPHHPPPGHRQVCRQLLLVQVTVTGKPTSTMQLTHPYYTILIYTQGTMGPIVPWVKSALSPHNLCGLTRTVGQGLLVLVNEKRENCWP